MFLAEGEEWSGVDVVDVVVVVLDHLIHGQSLLEGLHQ